MVSGNSDGSDLLDVARRGEPFWVVQTSVLLDRAEEAFDAVKQRCSLTEARDFRSIVVLHVAGCPPDLSAAAA